MEAAGRTGGSSNYFDLSQLAHQVGSEKTIDTGSYKGHSVQRGGSFNDATQKIIQLAIRRISPDINELNKVSDSFLKGMQGLWEKDKSQIREAGDAIDALTQDRDNFKAGAESLKKEIADEEAKSNPNYDKIDHLKGNLSATEGHIDKLNDQLAEARNNRSSLIQQYEQQYGKHNMIHIQNEIDRYK